jgi:hypothetical protein
MRDNKGHSQRCCFVLLRTKHTITESTHAIRSRIHVQRRGFLKGCLVPATRGAFSFGLSDQRADGGAPGKKTHFNQDP